MSEATALWERKPQSLRFTLGDFCYWQYPFEAMVLDAPLSLQIEGSFDPAALIASAPHGPSSYVVRAMPANGPLAKISSEAGFIRYAPAQYPRHFVKLEGTFPDYLAKFSAKSRSTMRRKVRKFADQAGGTIEWRQYRTPDEMRALYPLALELSRKTYQEKLFGDGFENHAGSLDKLVSQAERDLVRGYMLFLRGEPVAYV